MIITLITVLLLAFGLAGCGKDTDDKSAEKTAVEIGMLKLTSSAPLFIALEKGFFEDEGLDAKAKWFEAAQPISVATAGGDVQVGGYWYYCKLIQYGCQRRKVSHCCG